MKTPSKQYIAGLFDGEGSIGIYSRKDRYNGTCLRTQLTQNKSRESTMLLQSLVAEYGGSLSGAERTSTGRMKYNWQLNPKGVKRFLKDIFPYLVLKRSQAALAFYWMKHRPQIRRDSDGMVVPFTKEEVAFTQKVVRLMKELKTKDIATVMEHQQDLVEVVVELEPMAVVKG